MCILFTLQLTQAACGDNHDKNTKYEDHVQKKREKKTTVAHQSGT